MHDQNDRTEFRDIYSIGPNLIRELTQTGSVSRSQYYVFLAHVSSYKGRNKSFEIVMLCALPV